MIYILLAIVLPLVLTPVALHVANEYRRLRHSWRMDNLHIWTATQTARLDILDRHDWHERQREMARLEIRRNRARLLAEVSGDD